MLMTSRIPDPEREIEGIPARIVIERLAVRMGGENNHRGQLRALVDLKAAVEQNIEALMRLDMVLGRVQTWKETGEDLGVSAQLRPHTVGTDDESKGVVNSDPGFTEPDGTTPPPEGGCQADISMALTRDNAAAGR